MKVIAFTYVLDEREYMAKNIENSLEQGLTPIVINNGCSDGTSDVVREYGVPIYEHFTSTFHLHDMIYFGMNMAKEIGCDWIILKDADELMETYDGSRIKEILAEADAAGYNCVNFDSYSFWPTVDDDWNEPDFKKRIRRYTWFDIPWIRAIKNSPEIWIDHPHLPGGEQRLSPVKLIIRHYKFLNAEQGRRKVWSRKARYNPLEVAKGSHTHYNKYEMKDNYFVLEPEIYSKLNVYNEDRQWVREQVWDEWR
jgi:glycosyltransferase involved in cell wall biosynthesis